MLSAMKHLFNISRMDYSMKQCFALNLWFISRVKPLTVNQALTPFYFFAPVKYQIRFHPNEIIIEFHKASGADSIKIGTLLGLTGVFGRFTFLFFMGNADCSRSALTTYRKNNDISHLLTLNTQLFTLNSHFIFLNTSTQNATAESY